jgi:hypothetical protein
MHMVASMIFGLICIVGFAALQVIKPGKSVFER